MNYLQILKEFFLYGVGGGLAFLINLTLVYLFTEGLKLYYLVSAILGYSLSLVFNFIFQALITFETKDNFIKRFLKFSLCQLTGLLIYSFLVYLFTDIFKIFYLISVTLSSLFVFIFNFALSRIFAFKK